MRSLVILFSLLVGVALVACCPSPTAATATLNNWSSNTNFQEAVSASNRGSVTTISLTVTSVTLGGGVTPQSPAGTLHLGEDFGPSLASANIINGQATIEGVNNIGTKTKKLTWHVARTAENSKLTITIATSCSSGGPSSSPAPSTNPGSSPSSSPIPSNSPAGTGGGPFPSIDPNGIDLPDLPNQPTGDFSYPTAKKNGPPANNIRSAAFGNWPNSHLSAACKHAHDSYWVMGPDGQAYHTWHPHTETLSSGEVCEFGHEHGSNPATSKLFIMSGGWPPFGLLHELHPRNEDHVGHKVNVANNFRAGLGSPQNKETPVYDAGFNCHFLSKIHMGTHSADAATNHLHEYFLTFACNDAFTHYGQARDATWFTIKKLSGFGEPNMFRDMCGGYVNVRIPATNVKDLNNQIITATSNNSPPGSDNREFTCFDTLRYKEIADHRQPELWTGRSTVETGAGSLNFGPYYIVKNSARVYDSNLKAFRYTIDYCYDASGARVNLGSHPYCIGAPSSNPGWNSKESPFKGTIRAVNFKSSQIWNYNGNKEFCTDVHGKFRSTTPCNYGNGDVYQAVSTTKNEWSSSRSHNGHSGQVGGSFSTSWPSIPGLPGARSAPGIGFEHFETHDYDSVRGFN